MLRLLKLFEYVSTLVVISVLYFVKVVGSTRTSGKTSVKEGSRSRQPLVTTQKTGISKTPKKGCYNIFT